MSQYDNNRSVPEYLDVGELPSDIISALFPFLHKIRDEQKKFAIERARRREMQNELHRAAIERMPLDLRYWLKVPRN